MKPEDLPKTAVRKRALDLAERIAEMLSLSPQTVEQRRITEEV